ncbi:MAG: HEAT repeat domain-containing protein [Planctomycetes bacterium]|nr:HEAT repeat domain-containing protein [Planctomycetota bacterium]
MTQSLSDPNLVSPACVVQALDELPPTAAALDVFEMAQSLKEAKYRTEAVQSLDRWPGVSETAAQARYAEILLRCAHDPSADVRMAMLSGKWPDYGLRPLVAERLKSSDGTQRQQAFVLIQRAWPGSFTEEIRSGCGDPSPDVRMSALICLQNDRLDVSFRRDLAVASLADADARVATLAAQILRKIPGVSWNDALVTAVIRAMTRAFSQLGTIGLWTELKQLHSAREFNGYSSTILTPDLIDLYVATTNPKSEVGSAERVTIRTWILDKVLDQRRDDGHAEEIVAAGFAAIPSAEERAAWLRRWHGWVSSLTGVLATAVGAPEPSVRLEGYRRLLNAARGQGKNISTPPHLAEDLASSDEELRAAALALAANCPDPSLVRPIRAIHDAATGQARASALNALVACGGKDALADVRRDLESDDAETYFAARDFIVSLLGDDAVDDLVRLARRIVDPSVAVSGTGLSRSALARFVSQIPADQLTKGLIECLADRLPDEAAAQLAAITLKSSSPDVQSAGASLAQHRNVRGAIPALLRLLGSSEANVRDAAEGALKSMQRYQELRATFDKFGEGGRDDALAKARSLLKDPSPEKRRGAVLAIAAVGDAGAASLLLDALSDADAGVRSAALQALEKLGAK